MIKIIQGDITSLNVDVIVNAANPQLQAGGGVCGAIFKNAGKERLQQECSYVVRQSPTGVIPFGNSALTTAFDLPSKFIVHAVGPIYTGGNQNEAFLLRNAYYTAMQLVLDTDSKSVAFPFISSGIYGYPKKEACEIAVGTLKEFEVTHPEIEINVCCFADEDYQLFLNEVGKV